MSESTDRRLGNFRILERLGRGGERTVFRAECLVAEGGIPAGDVVALCCLPDRDPRLFEREARILARLNHPAILRYRHSFVHHDPLDGYGQLCCLVTELLLGEPLSQRIARAHQGRGLPWEEIKGNVTQILQALEYASASGVDHRDLKPANIFLTQDGGAKIIDFGIARLRCDPAEPASVACMKGSWDYLAPEFAHPPKPNFQGDERSDIYSFGVSLYQALTGQLPFEPLSGDQAAIQFVQRWSSPDGPPEPRFRHSAFRVRPKLAECLARCLQADRARRFASFGAVLEGLSGVAPLKVAASNAAESYECLDFLGAGGFGEVFRARHWRDGADVGRVAVKRLMQSRTAVLHEKAQERFAREANLLKQLQHANLVRYIDFQRLESLTGPQFFLILEYLPGMPEAGLRSRIVRSQSGLPAGEVRDLFAGYLAGLEYLHQANIIHRDIKPHNLYAPAQEPEKAKIFDLGIALDLDSMDKSIGPIPGSWDYMPPEFAFKSMGRGTPQSDLYSLGVTLFQALTGKLPFPELKSSTEYVMRAQKPPAPAFDHPVFTEFPRLREVLLRALSPKPAGRFEKARDMAEALREAFSTPVVPPLEPPTDHGGGEAYALVFGRIRAALAQKDYASAQRLCEGILEAQPAHPEAGEWLAISRGLAEIEEARRKGQSEAAERFLNDLQRRYPGNPLWATSESARISGMQNAIRNQNWSAVTALVEQAAAAQPPVSADHRVPMLHTAIMAAEVALQGQAWSSARKLCEAILSFESNYGPAQKLRGLIVALESAAVFASMRDWTRSVRELESARRTHPKHPVLLGQLSTATRELALQNQRVTEGLQQAQEAFPAEPAQAIEMVEALLGEAPDTEAVKILNRLFAECHALAGAQSDAQLESAGEKLQALRAEYSPERLAALELAPMSGHLDDLLARYSSSGTTTVVNPQPANPPVVPRPQPPVIPPREAPTAQVRETPGTTKATALPWWKGTLTLRAGLISAAVAVTLTVVLSWAYLQQSQGARMERLRAGVQKFADPAPDAELSAILARAKDPQGLLTELQAWWPRQSTVSTLRLELPGAKAFGELLDKALKLQPITVPAPRLASGLLDPIQRRLQEKQRIAQQYAALGGTWNQVAGETPSSTTLARVIEDLQKDPQAVQGLDGFAAALARATHGLTGLPSGSPNQPGLSKTEYIQKLATAKTSNTVHRAGTGGFSTAGTLLEANANQGSTNVIRFDQDLNIRGNVPRPAGTNRPSLDSEFKALLIWGGFTNNTEGTLNPEGYTPQVGKRAERLTGALENDRPNRRQIDDLQRRFEANGKLNENNRPLFDKLRAWGHP